MMTLSQYEKLIRKWERQVKMVDPSSELQVLGWRFYLQYLKVKGEQYGEDFVAVYQASERRLATHYSVFLHD